MDLRCYLCKKRLSGLSEANKHLKIVHFVRENLDEMCCLVDLKNRTQKCTKTYKTFKSMNEHVKKCSLQNTVEKVKKILYSIYEELMVPILMLYIPIFSWQSLNCLMSNQMMTHSF